MSSFVKKSKNKRQRQRRLIRYLILVLALLSILILLFVLLIYRQNRRAVRDSRQQMETAQVRELSQSTSQLIHLANNAAMQFFHSPGIAPLKKKGPPANAEMIEAMRELNAFVSASDYLDSLYLINPEQGVIYTSLEYHQRIDTFEDILALEQLKKFRAGELSSPLPAKRPTIGNYDLGPELLRFIYTGTGDDRSALLLNLNYAWVQQLLFPLNEDYYVILTADGELLLRNERAEKLEEKTLDLVCERLVEGELPQGISCAEFGSHLREDHLLYITPLEDLPYYVAHIRSYPQVLFNAKAVPGLRFTLGVLVIVFIGLVYILIQELVQPFRGVLQVLDQNPEFFDAAAEVQTAQAELSDFLAQATTTREEKTALDRRNRFRQMLAGRLPQDCAALLPLPDTDNAVWGLYAAIDEDVFKTLPDTAVRCQYNDVQYALVAQTGISDLLDPKLPHSYTPIADPKADLAALADALWELEKLRPFHPDPPQVARLPGLGDLASDLTYDDRAQQDILRAIQSGRRTAAFEQFDRFLHQLGEDRWVRVQLQLSQLFLSLRELLPPDYPTVSLTEFGEFLDTFFTREDLIAFYRGLMEAAIDKQLENRSERYASLIRKVDTIIEEQFKDPNTHVGSIADALELTSAYLSRLYKEETGRSLSQTLTDRRLDFASGELLSTTDAIAEIAYRSGIDNPPYFYTLFKKRFKMTPTEWRHQKGPQ